MSLSDMDRARIRVDFNEMVQENVVLLSKTDEVEDSDGNQITLSEGLKVLVYEFNHYDDGEKEHLLAEGVATLNDTKINGEWSKAAKWCCRLDENGITVKNS